jgi:hypothetical protein
LNQRARPTVVGGLLALALLALALACTSVDAAGRKTLAKRPAPDGGFLEHPERMAELRDRDPFHRVWYASDFSFAPYTRIAVAPVDTGYVREMNLWAKMTFAVPRVDEDVEVLAVELRDVFADTIREDPRARLELVESGAEGTLLLEMALIEVVPNKAWLGTLGLVSRGTPVPGVGVATGTAATLLDRGWVSIEGRLRDARTGQVLVQFADSEKGKLRVIDFEVLTWYGHAHEIFREWAQQFVERVNTPLHQPVEETPWFTLRPW